MPLDKEEPVKIAQAVKKMGLRYVVLTSVTRDDLADGGARHFAATIREIKKENEGCYIECLIPDLKGDATDLETILSEDITVLNHNLETISENYARIRPEASYKSSLNILKNAKRSRENIFTKTGFMLGLGENLSQVKKLLEDIRSTGCDMVTIGQYLRPSGQQYRSS
ncbi:MAG: lipoyl synthase [Actinomycetota bacterium]|nr:lipoyl synthase [Actinomycetota bacterium]